MAQFDEWEGKNSLGLEKVGDEVRHIPRTCDVCQTPRSVKYGVHKVWYCLDCYAVSGLWKERN